MNNKSQHGLKHSLGHTAQSSLAFCVEYFTCRVVRDCGKGEPGCGEPRLLIQGVQSLSYEQCRMNRHVLVIFSQTVVYSDSVLSPLLICLCYSLFGI